MGGFHFPVFFSTPDRAKRTRRGREEGGEEYKNWRAAAVVETKTTKENYPIRNPD